ncbi:MAG: hypothetical protein ABR499_08720 [Gemmatimonadaceae bacterium]
MLISSSGFGSAPVKRAPGCMRGTQLLLTLTEQIARATAKNLAYRRLVCLQMAPFIAPPW